MGLSESLEDLADLHRRGDLTHEEFVAAKARLLNDREPQRESDGASSRGRWPDPDWRIAIPVVAVVACMAALGAVLLNRSTQEAPSVAEWAEGVAPTNGQLVTTNNGIVVAATNSDVTKMCVENGKLFPILDALDRVAQPAESALAGTWNELLNAERRSATARRSFCDAPQLDFGAREAALAQGELAIQRLNDLRPRFEAELQTALKE
jgi:hypothetical protein